MPHHKPPRSWCDSTRESTDPQPFSTTFNPTLSILALSTGSIQQDPSHLPSHTLDRSLEHLGNRYQSLVVATNPPGFPQDFARSMVNAVSLLGSVLRTIVNTQPNVRRPVVMSAAEVRETNAKLARIVNDYVAPPQHSPADGRLCLGRMSDGSKCQLLADRCYHRAEGVHISTPGLNRRCHHKWPRCQIHNPKYHETFSSYHGHVHRSTGLVSSRSALLYDIEKDYGNREHDVIQGGKRVTFQGPHFPTAHAFARHSRRLQEFDTLLESLNDPDVDAQGPAGPPDQHPGPPQCQPADQMPSQCRFADLDPT
ncbi:hypothetical protein Ae201684P_000384 [Aphanomyces euteiches]|nr:hypothetical protein Ae201684P_000384 [Aphanomyces euteiches]